jgi:hypothetical protein
MERGMGFVLTRGCKFCPHHLFFSEEPYLRDPRRLHAKERQHNEIRIQTIDRHGTLIGACSPRREDFMLSLSWLIARRQMPVGTMLLNHPF